MRHNSPRVQVGPGRKPSEIRPSVSLSACRLLEFTAKAPEMRAHRTATAAPPHRLPNRSARYSTVMRRIIQNLGVYKQYRRIRSRKFDMC